MQYSGLLLLAFQIWMLVDAAQRRADYWWFFIILFLPPFGPFIYFFMIKMGDQTRMRQSLAQQLAITTGSSVKQLRYELKQTPSTANRLALATALYDRKEYAEAAEHYEQVLASHAHEKPALHGLGLCRLALGDHTRARELFQEVVDADASYAGYGSWRSLAQAKWACGEKEAALEEMRELIGRDTRVETKADYAHLLIEAGRNDEAKQLLEAAIEDYKHSPQYVRRLSRPGYRRAKKLLATA